MIRKKLTAAVLGVALFASAVVAAPSAVEAKTFSDVPSSHWAYSTIDEASNKGLVNGMGNGQFSPDTPLLDTHIIQMFYNIAPNKSTNGVTTYSGWYADAANWASAKQFGQWGSNAPVDRARVARLMFSYISRFYPEAIPNDVPESAFTDINDLEDEMTIRAIDTLAEMGLIYGRSETSFAPNASLTRAEATAIVLRMYNRYNGTSEPVDNHSEEAVMAELYLDIIEKYQQIANGEIDAATVWDMGLNTLIGGFQYGASYALVDLANDGTPELFIADGTENEFILDDFHGYTIGDGSYNVIDAYGFGNWSVSQLFDEYNGYRAHHVILDNGMVLYSGSSSAYSGGVWYYQLAPNSAKASLVQSTAYNFDTDEKYYKGTTGDANIAITEDEWRAINTQYDYKTDITWYSIYDTQALYRALGLK